MKEGVLVLVAEGVGVCVVVGNRTAGFELGSVAIRPGAEIPTAFIIL